MRKFLVVLFLLVPLLAQANLTIQITQGVDKPYPMAVVPFTKKPFVVDGMQQGMSGVIAHDLASTGRFEILPKVKLPQQPHRLDEFKQVLWSKTGVEYVLIGSIQASLKGDGLYDVQFQLLNALENRVLVGRLYNEVPQKRLRALAHFISDQVYQTLTGVRGYFSTRWAYVQVLKQRGVPTYELVVSDADGSNPRVLLSQVGNPIASPAWSPDGKQLAYVSYHQNRMTVYDITLSNGVRHILANFKGMNSAPAFSSDGKQIALALSKGNSARTNLYLMDLSDDKLTQLTHFGTNTAPSFSPDGQEIVFTSNRGGSPQIYQLSLKTHQVSRLTYQGVQNFAPQVTPDGKNIVFMHQASAGGPINIAKMNLSGNDIVTLTHGNLDKSPSIAPNGTMILYANYDGPHGILAEVSLDGRIQLNLPATQGTVQSPAWSPFLLKQ